MTTTAAKQQQQQQQQKESSSTATTGAGFVDACSSWMAENCDFGIWKRSEPVVGLPLSSVLPTKSPNVGTLSLEQRLQRMWRLWQWSTRQLAAAAASHDLSAARFINLEEWQSQWFHKLLKLHAEPQRHYHTWVHLEEMSSHWETFREAQTQKEEDEEDAQEEADFWHAVVILSVFFHDAIYETTPREEESTSDNSSSSSNEEKSAHLFQQFHAELQGRQRPKEVDEPQQAKQGEGEENPSATITAKSEATTESMEDHVVQFILETQAHNITPLLQDLPPKNRPRHYLGLFLDMDLAVLGKEPRAYQAYAALIRLEYAHVPHEIYCSKRAAILQGFLQQESLYATRHFRDCLERQARVNLQDEIYSLQRGRIPGEEEEVAMVKNDARE